MKAFRYLNALEVGTNLGLKVSDGIVGLIGVDGQFIEIKI